MRTQFLTTHACPIKALAPLTSKTLTGLLWMMIFFQRILTANNPKRWHSLWKDLYYGELKSTSIPPLINRTQTVAGIKEKANLLNSVFTSRGTNSQACSFPGLVSRTSTLLTHIHVTTEIVITKLRSLDISKSTGPDSIQNVVLKHCAESLRRH